MFLYLRVRITPSALGNKFSYGMNSENSVAPVVTVYFNNLRCSGSSGLQAYLDSRLIQMKLYSNNDENEFYSG
jgi:hypothetical protein